MEVIIKSIDKELIDVGSFEQGKKFKHGNTWVNYIVIINGQVLDGTMLAEGVSCFKEAKDYVLRKMKLYI